MASERDGPMASLIITAGPAEGKYFTLRSDTITIGRLESNVIQIVDPAISGTHMQVRFDDYDEAYFARDLGSTNGVRINGSLIKRDVQLMEGDELAVGDSTLRFSLQEFPDRESVLAYLRAPGQTARTIANRKDTPTH